MVINRSALVLTPAFIDPDRTVRLAIEIDDDPAEISVEPLIKVIRSIRA